MTDNTVEDTIRASSRETRFENERSLALEAVLNNAPELGVKEALKRFGGPLTVTERELVSGLSKAELTGLKVARGKLGSLGSLAKDNNNNNF